MLESTTPFGSQAMPGGGIVEKQGDPGGEAFGVGFKSDVDSIPRGETFGGQRRGHDTARCGPSFENLDAGAAAGAQGSHYDPSLGDLRPGVFHRSGNLDPRVFAGAGRQQMAYETVAAANQAQPEFRTQILNTSGQISFKRNRTASIFG